MRAHSNPLNDVTFPVPLNPDQFDWCAQAALPFLTLHLVNSTIVELLASSIPTSRAAHYPELHAAAAAEGRPPPRVEFADVGCGFGGLTVRLAEAYPDKLVMGMEIRDKVTGAWVGGGYDATAAQLPVCLRVCRFEQAPPPKLASCLPSHGERLSAPAIRQPCTNSPALPQPPQRTSKSASWRCARRTRGSTRTRRWCAPTP